ncbi:phenylacetate--CoA ligase family protein [Actinokineospora sp. NPDC004072]
MNLPGLLWDARQARRGGPDAIAGRQRDRLAAIIEHARTSSPFYRRLYRELPERVTDPAALPVVNKQALMAHFDDWVTDPELTEKKARGFVNDPRLLGQRLLGQYTVTTTSGTTGTHGIFVQDSHALAVAGAMMARMLGSLLTARDAAKILTAGRRIALVVPTGGHFATTTAAARMTADPKRAKSVGVFSVHDPLPQLVDALNQFRPAILAPYATVGAMLASEAEAGRLHIDPTLIVLAAEGLPPAEYDRIAATFGATVGTSYAANEVPFLSYSCDQHWLHVNADWVILEPVDANHHPVPAGQPSHTVLVSNLANRVQPILRYDLGDSVLARPDPCECGNPLPAIRVQGRASDLLTFTTPTKREVTLSPLALATLVERIPGIDLFQIVQTTPTTLQIRLQPRSGAEPEQMWATVHGDITRLLVQHDLSHITVERAEEPPQQTAGGKYRAVIPLT